MAYEHLQHIRRTSQVFADKQPVILYDLQEQKIYAYPYREFKADLSERSQTILEEQYQRAIVNDSWWSLSVTTSNAGSYRIRSISNRPQDNSMKSKPTSRASTTPTGSDYRQHTREADEVLAANHVEIRLDNWQQLALDWFAPHEPDRADVQLITRLPYIPL